MKWQLEGFIQQIVTRGNVRGSRDVIKWERLAGRSAVEGVVSSLALALAEENNEENDADDEEHTDKGSDDHAPDGEGWLDGDLRSRGGS